MATEERREEKQRSDAGGQHAATEKPPHTAYSLLGKQTPTADLKRGLCAIPTGSSAYLGTYTRLQDTTVLEEFRVIRIIPTISLAANLGEAINKSKGTQSIQQCAGTDPKGLQCCGQCTVRQHSLASKSRPSRLESRGLCVAFAQLHYSLLVLPDSP